MLQLILELADTGIEVTFRGGSSLRIFELKRNQLIKSKTFIRPINLTTADMIQILNDLHDSLIESERMGACGSGIKIS